ncbi:MAG: restriction endonuclease subunit R [Proteobacteria bacterium]|nr:restriction endonuclease subunit R [Pseudomonadota bacterium]
MSFASKLVLAPWALKQLGVADFDRLSEILRAPEFEGWAEDGGSKFVHQLIARLPKQGRSVADDQLRDYDSNIVGHWKHITKKRNLLGPTLYPLYFQYLGLLMTEMYLDRYFSDTEALLYSLNHSVKAFNEGKAVREHITNFVLDDLNKSAFWMATGSGKTLLMHCHIRQYLHYLGKAGQRKNLNRIILLTPNEGLSRQHKDEFEQSGIEAEFYDKDGATLFTGRGVDIIDINKLRETSGQKTVAVDTFEGNNLVLVDEGHRGSGGEVWKDFRRRISANGFSFEYSATFGQSVKASTGAKQKELTQEYAKCILFDYSYKFFYNDGYGKDFNILNLADQVQLAGRDYLTGSLLSFYQQRRRFADGGAELKPYLLADPLMIFVGGSVSGTREQQEETDLVQILKFLASFVADRKETEISLEKLLTRKMGFVAGGKTVFDELYPYVETLWSGTKASECFLDILRHVFNAPSPGQLHIVRLMGSDGEIGLRIGTHDWFGVVNVGDAKGLCDRLIEAKGENDHFVVEDMAFSGSLFAGINATGSPIRLLAGAKKFSEGWSSWRVTAMGLMNVGKKEGSEIIQLFGRGVRLRGYKFKLKRTSALDALDLQGDDMPTKHPEHIALMETLNIFGIRSNYMQDFEEYLEEEGVGEDERRELIFLPTIKLPEIDKLELNIIRTRKEMPDFKKEVTLQLASLEGKLNGMVVADWYPRLQKQSSVAKSGDGAAPLNREPLTEQHLAFLDWNAVWFELERHKRDKAYYNVLFRPEALQAIMNERWWYELYIPPGYLDFRFDKLAFYQELAIHLLKGYLDRFCQFHKREFEAPFLEYQLLTKDDELLLKQYQILVKKSERQLINRLRALGEKFADGTFEAMSFEKLDIFRADKHLYQPLIHLSHSGAQEALVKIMPTHLNEGEKQFVNDLEAFCKAEAKGVLGETELYLLRNHSSDKGISFFAEAGFRPDFILWLLREDKQTIAFLDPKGLRNFTDNFNNPKIQFFRRIKDLQALLKRTDIQLESFLISHFSRLSPTPHPQCQG